MFLKFDKRGKLSKKQSLNRVAWIINSQLSLVYRHVQFPILFQLQYSFFIPNPSLSSQFFLSIIFCYFFQLFGSSTFLFYGIQSLRFSLSLLIFTAILILLFFSLSILVIITLTVKGTVHWEL